MSKVGNFFKMCGNGTLYFLKNLPRYTLNILKYLQKKQMLTPLIMLFFLIILNVILDTTFFNIRTAEGGVTLQGSIINVLFFGAPIVILSIGMTFVTSACGGQDISVGATSCVAASVMLVSYLAGVPLIVSFLLAIIVGVVFCAFNGALVAYFKILPMVATLVLFTSGRSIAYAIGSGSKAYVSSDSPFLWWGNSFPGFPIQTPILITAVVIAAAFLILKFTNLRLYTESVGINPRAARLNGIKPERIKMLSFIILGVCVGLSAFVLVTRVSSISYDVYTIDIELDVILAVAIGGTALGGGKFNLAGSIIGAYSIRLLQMALIKASFVTTENIKAFKAIVIIILVVLVSPVVKEKFSILWAKLTNFLKNTADSIKERRELKKNGIGKGL